ncbi:MAG: LysE family transporter [Bacteroidota bacterium]
MSPGPDFVMTVRNTLCYSRRSGIFTGLGISTALMIHLFYCAAGIGLIISAIVIATAFCWFSIVSIFLSQPKIQQAFLKYERAINYTLGGFLILLGIKIALTFR